MQNSSAAAIISKLPNLRIDIYFLVIFNTFAKNS
jgi:hypothetical protein